LYISFSYILCIYLNIYVLYSSYVYRETYAYTHLYVFVVISQVNKELGKFPSYLFFSSIKGFKIQRLGFILNNRNEKIIIWNKLNEEWITWKTFSDMKKWVSNSNINFGNPSINIFQFIYKLLSMETSIGYKLGHVVPQESRSFTNSYEWRQE